MDNHTKSARRRAARLVLRDMRIAKRARHDWHRNSDWVSPEARDAIAEGGLHLQHTKAVGGGWHPTLYEIVEAGPKCERTTRPIHI